MDSEIETREVVGRLKKPWWSSWRIWLAIWVLTVPLVVVLAFVRSNQSTIVIYNDTGLPLASVTIRACGQEYPLPTIDRDNSFRIRLPRGGGESDVSVSSTAEPTIDWAGGYIEPRGGYRIELRVRADGSITYNAQFSFWKWRF